MDAELKKALLDISPTILDSDDSFLEDDSEGDDNVFTFEQEKEAKVEAKDILNAIRAENKFKTLTTICEEDFETETVLSS